MLMFLALLWCETGTSAAQIPRPERPPPDSRITLGGRVHSKSGAPMSGIEVTSTSAAGVKTGTVTDDAGQFHFENLRPAVYVVEAERGDAVLSRVSEVDLRTQSALVLDLEIPIENSSATRNFALRRSGLLPMGFRNPN